jgi:two-component system response regulator MprA
MTTVVLVEAFPRVLVVEDDPQIRSALTRVLTLEGYDTDTVTDGREALDRLAHSRPDVVVMDVMMPFVDGLTVCRELRAAGNRVPILLLTARHEVGDRVLGLDAGADDYLAKPFAIEELLARVRALLRRTVAPEDARVLAFGDLTVDLAARGVTRAGRTIHLTKTEFDLLQILVEQQGIVLSRDYIYEHIWGYHTETTSKSLDVYIGYLRRKLEEAGERRILHTIRGVGYVIRDDNE